MAIDKCLVYALIGFAVGMSTTAVSKGRIYQKDLSAKDTFYQVQRLDSDRDGYLTSVEASKHYKGNELIPALFAFDAVSNGGDADGRISKSELEAFSKVHAGEFLTD